MHVLKDRPWTRDGFGQCGCTWPPHGHDEGCLWGLDEYRPVA